MIAKFFEFTRFMIIGLTTFFCYSLFYNNPPLMLHYFMLGIVMALSGLTGIEGFFFSKQTAESLGRDAFHNPYQYQSAVNNIAVAITGGIVWFARWGTYAEAAVLLVTLIFITLSASIHTWEAIKLGNQNRKNKLRGIWTISLLVVSLPIIWRAVT